ncbi:hypothetical protein [Falsirhodobacter halotolerans]|uniref:hypothetical protein n=1 Tax=Falsirhodobacter halotolerans TaxID=1146892 RepID=UPI001FD391B5|nr:hypothetical protein [Falsirhodobacter halotolerans]MCJ8138833.1 hypothetical protein [Falsirhodobacter halotolerans]
MKDLRFRTISLTLLIVTFGFLGISAATVSDLNLFFKEGHGLELASVGVLFAAVVLWLWLAGPYRWREWQIPFLFLAMAAREMDADKRFTDYGLLKLNTYTGPAPWGEKLLGAAIIALTLWASWRLLTRNAPLWWQRLKAGRLDAWLIAGAFVLGVVAKTIDGLGRKLAGFGIEISAQTDQMAGRTEEVLELACYLMLAIAVARLSSLRGAR